MLNFLKEVDKLFKPSLEERVVLKEYNKKILKLAEIYVAYEKEKIVGAIAIYMNDFKLLRANISLLAILKEYQKQGIGKKLMILAIKNAQKEGMKKVWISTDNYIALELYKKLGFKIISINKNNFNYIKYELERLTNIIIREDK